MALGLAACAQIVAPGASAELAPSPVSLTPPDAARTLTLEVPADLDAPSVGDLLAVAGVHVLSLEGHGPSRVGRFWQVRATPAARAHASRLIDGAAWWPAVPRGMRPLDAVPVAAPDPWDLPRDAPHLATDLAATHALRDGAGRPVTGHGVVICAVDFGGVDLLHPHLFRADGGVVPWIDVDGDGRLTVDVDEVEVDGLRARLRWLPATPVGVGAPAPLGFSEDPTAGWLYADVDGSGAREAGPEHGFDDTAPAYGEPLFLAEDTDGDGVIGLGEPLLRLATSKVRGIYRVDDRAVYTRGVNLLGFRDVPWRGPRDHGNSTSSVLVGGHPGAGRLHGVAPDADLIIIDVADDDGDSGRITDEHFYGGLVEGYSWARDHGAHVYVHGYGIDRVEGRDGTGWHEQMVDVLSASGALSATATGNEASDERSAWIELAPGDRVEVTLDLHPAVLAGAGLVRWHGPGASGLEVTLAAADGLDHGFAYYEDGVRWNGEDYRWATERGVEVGAFYWRHAVPSRWPGAGTWTLTADAAGSSGSVRLAVALMPWERSDASADVALSPASALGTMTPPSTADTALAASAYDVAEAQATGEFDYVFYANRGPRIDGLHRVHTLAPTGFVVAAPAPVHGTPAPVRLFYGTSASVAYLGGALALLRQVAPDLDASAVQALFAAPAADAVPPALDVRGLVAPFAAVEPGPTPAEPAPADVSSADADAVAPDADAAAPDGVDGPSVARSPGGCSSGGDPLGGGAAVAALLVLVTLAARRRRALA